ncbi:PI-PLC domain-containing protein [Aureispira anguillae]|uniref:Uncharacterized protein n=1 Tax=Aureispira anguillae TaxID=2864201 RepID=A0A916DUJ8_9BACT|nr:hypothetical protein [Aureispira anguillae]BDS12595.1 hypothetical protein AsAng_0033190 [Aureispira anguillae]
MIQKIIFLLLLNWGGGMLQAQLSTPLPNGHAHNDYEKPWSPLTKALEEGFVSVEIDVFPYRKELKVAHIGLFLGAAPSIETLYFKALEQWLDTHGQLFKEKHQRLIFMIDIKQDATQCYALLRRLCLRYDHLITKYYPQQDSVVYGVVDILLSGKKPYQEVLQDSVRYMLIDGGLGDLKDSLRTAQIAPRISIRYGSLFKWRGRGNMPADELKLLRSIVKSVHISRRKLRFWGMPNHNLVWKQLLDEGVDWMNVDDLEKFRRFYEKYKNK